MIAILNTMQQLNNMLGEFLYSATNFLAKLDWKIFIIVGLIILFWIILDIFLYNEKF